MGSCAKKKASAWWRTKYQADAVAKAVQPNKEERACQLKRRGDYFTVHAEALAAIYLGVTLLTE